MKIGFVGLGIMVSPMAPNLLRGGFVSSMIPENHGRRMVERDFAAGIEARLHHKDFGPVLAAARQSGVPAPLTACVARQFNAPMAMGLGKNDTAVLLRVLETR